MLCWDIEKGIDRHKNELTHRIWSFLQISKRYERPQTIEKDQAPLTKIREGMKRRDTMVVYEHKK